MSLIAVTGDVRTAARANWGRWVAPCPRCPSALWVEPGVADVVCRDCRLPYEVVWPPGDMIAGVERLLMLRPNVVTRNWEPGETLHDLLEENVQHGLTMGMDVGDELAIIGDKITLDTLPNVPFQTAIGAH